MGGDANQPALGFCSCSSEDIPAKDYADMAAILSNPDKIGHANFIKE